MPPPDVADATVDDMSEPVMNELSSEARKSAAAVSSSG